MVELGLAWVRIGEFAWAKIEPRPGEFHWAWLDDAIDVLGNAGLKVILGLLLGILLTSQIRARGYLRSVVFFPVLVSTVGVGITFTAFMDPSTGAINKALATVGVDGPGWLTDPSLALFSVALVDVWKGVGLATVIYIAGIVSIPNDYYEAAKRRVEMRKSPALWAVKKVPKRYRAKVPVRWRNTVVRALNRSDAAG